MKYAVIIPDGAADLPIDELDGRTPLEAARTPNLDRLAATGRVGCAATTPPGFPAGSDVCSMSLLGYDPQRYHTGRAPLEAAALGIDLADPDWVFRLNFVAVGENENDDGLMLDHSAGGLTAEETAVLAPQLLEHWRAALPADADSLRIVPGAGYRAILVDSSGDDFSRVATTPPHEIPGLPWADHLPAHQPRSPEHCAERLRRLMHASRAFLADHPVNSARRQAGKRPANTAWIWGQGQRPDMPAFNERFGLRGAMISPVDLLVGIAALIGWDNIPVRGMTGYHDTDYAAQGRAVCEALDDYDIVCCQVESPDEASHQGDWRTKVEAIEAIDRHIVGPVARCIEQLGDPAEDADATGGRLLIIPDHYTLISTRMHDPTPVPFLMAGAWVRSLVQRPFSERAAAESDLQVDPGHDLMEYFLKGGLARVRPRPPGTSA